MKPAKMISWTLIIFSQLSFLFSAYLHRFKRVASLEGKRCPEDSVLFSRGKALAFHCAGECLRTPGCVSVVAKEAEKKCWGCSTCQPDPSTMTDDPGATFWHTMNFIVFGRYGLTRDQFSQSSSKGHDQQYMAYQGNPRVPVWRYGTTCWGASVINQQQWVQVDFRRAQTVCAILTQAHGHWRWPNRVTEYRVLYSDDCTNFNYVLDKTSGEPKLFPGNTDWTSNVINDLPKPVTSRCFRINPTGWFSSIEMRFDMIGCAMIA